MPLPAASWEPCRIPPAATAAAPQPSQPATAPPAACLVPPATSNCTWLWMHPYVADLGSQAEKSGSSSISEMLKNDEFQKLMDEVCTLFDLHRLICMLMLFV